MRESVLPLIATAIVAVMLAGPIPPERPGGAPAPSTFQPDAILEHIKVLSGDDLEGRAPGTAGEEKTLAYLTGQFRAMGLKPGNPDGTYLQKVPLVGFQATAVRGGFQAGGKAIDLEFPRNFVAVSRGMVEKADVADSPVVFVGYGVVAPEYGWDDYKGLDVRDKTLIMLVNDPAVPDPKDPAKLDPSFFKGRAMTYYGRWTYKYEIAAEKKAAAVILIHEEGPAGYPFEVVRGSWSRENFDIARDDRPGAADRAAVEGWIDLPTAEALFQAAGQDLSSLKRAAVSRDFKPVILDVRASFSVTNTLRSVQSHNVVAKIEGSDPALRDQQIIYTAHWDHLGRDPKIAGDQIYNGAADNASGVASVLEIARAFAKSDPPPRRSILFLAVTAEEKGLLGSKYYATHPLYPLEKTLADINLDVTNLWGKTRDVISIGMGQSTLDDLLVEVAGAHGRSVGPDAEPEKGYYYRSDHFEFAKEGVPALDPKGGRQYIGKPDDYAQKKINEYTRNDYHKVSDEVKPDWDLSGAAEDARLMLELGQRIDSRDGFPEWKPDSEFRARREAMLKGARP
jgi:Zn-dependent M28 family amino/carboxypeptidase